MPHFESSPFNLHVFKVAHKHNTHPFISYFIEGPEKLGLRVAGFVVNLTELMLLTPMAFLG